MWTLGTLVGLPITLAVVATLIYVGTRLRRYNKSEAARRNYDDGMAGVAGIAAYVVAGVFVIGILSPLGMYPYEAQYHRYDDKSGTVSQTSKRIVSSSGDISQKYVVRFVDSQQEYGCEDTRCALIGKGDHITLACKRSWQYAGIDGWDCKFVRNGGVS